YHTVENVGIIALGAGLALVGRARGDLALVALGFGGAALHVVNHAVFKSLLFFGAGAVHHGTGTRALDQLGGLLRRMPSTGLFFLVGAVAISGLPPLNGFVSEWLVYLGFLETLGRPSGDLLAFAAAGMPVLALVGGLAAACFAKVVGVVFLGEPRTAAARGAHEAPRSMVAPMAILAAVCVAIGLAPGAVLAPLRNAAAAWARVDPALLEGATARAAAAAARVSLVAAVLLLAAGALLLLRRRRLAAHAAPAAVATWGCGFAAPTPRMQYTGSSFAALLVSRFGWVVRPRVHGAPPAGTFPSAAGFHADVPDTVLDLLLLPAARAYHWAAIQARLLYLRRIQFQILLILATLLAVLAWGFVW
ncbi:MAG TPA: proton-conducting transporter membrane subunit, partial [Anaeromyxobacteraceae bacterium]|nr:proton-conducting transporter membrane subunit [Anaeromyxobacteraceae bacterium]